MAIRISTDPDFTKWFNKFLLQEDDGNTYDHLEMAFAAGKNAAQQSVQLTAFGEHIKAKADEIVERTKELSDKFGGN